MAAELPLGADLARHPRHLVREREQGVHHPVDGPGESGDFSLCLDGDLLREVAACDRSGDGGDRADLASQVVRHHVDVVGQVLPRAGRAAHPGLAAQVPLGANLARHPRHLVSERRQLVDHRVDRGLQLLDLAPCVHVDLLRQVALGNRRGDLGYVADLGGEVAGHQVDRVGEVLPGARHAGYLRLPAKPTLGAYLACHPRDLGREDAQGQGHRVDRLGEFGDIALRADHRPLRQVAVGHRRQDPAGLDQGPGQAVHEPVGGIHGCLPVASPASLRNALIKHAIFGHRAADPNHLVLETLVGVGDLIEHGADLRHDVVAGHRRALPEVPCLHRAHRGEKPHEAGIILARVMPLRRQATGIGRRLGMPGRLRRPLHGVPSWICRRFAEARQATTSIGS